MKVAIKKAKKLVRNPKLFFQDSNILNRKGTNSSDQLDSEPRVIGHLDTVEEIKFDIKNKGIRNKDFSTIFLVSNSIKSLNKAPIFGDMLKNKNNFIGFREKTLFGLRVSDEVYSFQASYENLVHNKNWHSGLLGDFKNVILTGEYIKYAEFFRTANVNVRIIAILTEKNEMVAAQSYQFIDHFICHKSHNDCQFKKDLTFFSNTEGLLQAIGQRIAQAGSKPYDYLVPVVGSITYLPEIDELNSENIDMVISLTTLDKNIINKANNFSEYVDLISKNISYLLLKESWMQRYASYVTKQDTPSLIKVALQDGARVKIL